MDKERMERALRNYFKNTAAVGAEWVDFPHGLDVLILDLLVVIEEASKG